MTTSHGATFLDALHRNLAAHENIHASHRRRVAERAALNPEERRIATLIAEHAAAPATAPKGQAHG